jgi:RND superfamily putative drug exporter
MLLTGRRTWWLPRWLDRLLPHIDVEGGTPPTDASPAPQPA